MAKLETVDASVPPPKKPAGKRKKTFKKKRDKRVVHHGIVHIQASFNNTIITIRGSSMSWSALRPSNHPPVATAAATPFVAARCECKWCPCCRWVAAVVKKAD